MKRQFMHLCLTALLALMGGSAVMADNQITYSQGEAALNYGTGGKNAETYDVAMLIQNPALVGARILGVRIAFPFANDLSNASAWLTKQLPAIVSSKAGAPDITSKAFDIKEGTTEILFEQPYTLTAEGVYVGYSFDVAKVTTALRPVVTTAYTTPGGFYIHTTKVYRTAWRSLYTYAGDLAMEVLLEGDVIKTNAANVGQLPELNGQTGEPTTLTFEVVNYGAAGTSAIDYTINVNGQTLSATATPKLGATFGARAQVTTTLPSMSQKGNYPYTITIDKVNGMPNETTDARATGTLKDYNTLPKHRAVLEEYTGLWCGYCPRGFVGLEEMNRLFPDDFIGISYHNGDDMQITTNYPSNVAGFPDAWIDRVMQTDAYCGNEDYGTFGIDKAWKERCQVFAPAAVGVSSEWTDDNTLRATAHVTFPLAADECPYKVGFALVADGLTNESWAQSNYYAGQAGWPSNMNPFTSGSSNVYGLTFNDVIIDSSADRGIEGSLTAPIEEDVEQTFSYDFDISKISQKIVPADRTKLRVVAMLIDSQTGQIVNAHKAQAGQTSTGIQSAASAGKVVRSVRYFDIQGRPVSLPARGLFIKAETLNDGSLRTTKVRR